MSLTGDVAAPLRERNPMAARAVTLGIVLYCLIAWAAVIKLAGVGWDALTPDPVSYAQSSDERVE